MKKNFLLNFSILILLVLALVADKNETVRIKIVASIGVEEIKAKGEDSYLFYTINSIDCDNEGNIYVLDKKASCIKIFSKNGKFLRKILREGQGPEEIRNPYRLAINRFTGNIFVLQEHGFQMKEFDVFGRFVKSYALPEQFFHYFEFLEKDRIIYIAKKCYEEKTCSKFKILNLNTLKIEKKFAPIQQPSIVYAYQRFIIKEGILWTCPDDKMELVAYDMITGKEEKSILIKESYREYKIVRGPNWWAARLFNFAQPLLINRNIYILLTKQDFLSIGSPPELKSKKLTLYRLEKDRLKRARGLPEGDFMDLGTVWLNHIILYSWDPYPHIKVLEIND
ncbi:MAG: 6-bladed beta-propeller [Acidobacteriota bacterium]